MWRATVSANQREYLKIFFSFPLSSLKFRVMTQYIVGFIVKNRGFEESEISPEI